MFVTISKIVGLWVMRRKGGGDLKCYAGSLAALKYIGPLL